MLLLRRDDSFWHFGRALNLATGIDRGQRHRARCRQRMQKQFTLRMQFPAVTSIDVASAANLETVTLFAAL